MLGNVNVGPAIAVKDVEKAVKFYTETLGLKEVSKNDAGTTLKSGDSTVLIYQSQFAGTNKATYVGWVVPDVEAEVTELKGKGVEFDTFEMPGITWQGDVAVMGSMKAAWFKDPDGNILSFGNM